MTLHKDEQLKFCHRVLELHIDLFGGDAGSLSDGLTRRGLESQLLFQQVVWDDNKKPSKLHIIVHREGNPPIGRFPSQRPSNVERVSTPWLHNGRMELAYSFVPVGLLVYVAATSKGNYLNQCWPSYITSCGVTGCKWVDRNLKWQRYGVSNHLKHNCYFSLFNLTTKKSRMFRITGLLCWVFTGKL